MKEIVYFFTPFFNSILYNHQSISLVELSFLFSILLYDLSKILRAEKPRSAGANVIVFLSIILFINACYILFSELTWWKAIVNTLISIIAFKLISLINIIFTTATFQGFYRFKSPESEGIIKRRAFVYFSIIMIVVSILNVMLINIKLN